MNGKAYFGLGSTDATPKVNIQDFYEFDPSNSSNHWKKLADFPGTYTQHCIAFSAEAPK